MYRPLRVQGLQRLQGSDMAKGINWWKIAIIAAMVLAITACVVSIVALSNPTRTPPPPAGSNVTTRNPPKQDLEEGPQASGDAENSTPYTTTGQKVLAYVMLRNWQNYSRDANLLWDTKHSKTQLKNIEYLPGGFLRVPETGCYRINATLDYEKRNGSDGDEWIDRVYRTEGRFLNKTDLREKLKKKLFSISQTPGDSQVSEDPKKLFYLHRDDLLSVRSSRPDLLRPEFTYFFVELIPDSLTTMGCAQ